jgi:release factor glutamine methyltransferase
VEQRPAAGPRSKVGDALDAAIDGLEAAGVADARLDAEVLLAEAMGVDRAALAADREAGVPPTAARRFGETVRRRLRREPVAYILGRKGFRNIELAVDPRALIPRPETELLVEIAVELEPGSVLDVGTGSGAVALAIADELPRAQVLATDTSEAALDVAWANARHLGLTDRVRFEQGTLPEGEGFGLVVANLPYVAAADWDGLAPEISGFEPREALVAGVDGLDAIRSLLEAVGRGEVQAGALALEVGAGQAAEVGRLVERAGYPDVEARRDLAGIERVVLGRR